MAENHYRFFLGGRDLEMVTIAGLLRELGVACEDRGLAWGAKASDHGEGIALALARGEVPVLVELAPDLPADLAARCLWIDHHGEAAGKDRPSSLRQVFDLLRLPESRWGRHFALVAANDVGHVRGLIQAGASAEDVDTIRAADRRAQGVTPEEETQARAALAAAVSRPGYLLLHLPHDRSSIVADFARPPTEAGESEDMLVLTPLALAWYGRGQAVRALAKRFGGWWGGALPERGYWGQTKAEAPLAAVEDLLDRL